jgi:hypothetical protein
VVFAKTALATTVVTTCVWILATLATKPEPDAILLSFYRKVRPQVTGWRRVARRAPEIVETHDLGRNLWLWALGCAMTYGALFGVGKLLLRQWTAGTILALLAIVCGWRMWLELGRIPEDTSGNAAVTDAGVAL